HRLKHGSGWTPAPASKDHPPGWTSPTQRCYASEHQDWEPPRWPPHTPTTQTDTETDTPPDQDLPTYPEPEPPPDPFPDWHAFTATHPWPGDDADTEDTYDPGWPDDPGEPGFVNDPFPECAAYQDA
ncbi:endonuclease, partial [Arthrobacter sp. 2RAF6]